MGTSAAIPEQVPVQAKHMTMNDIMYLASDHLVECEGARWLLPGTPYRALMAMYTRSMPGGPTAKAMVKMWVIFQKDLADLEVSYV